LNDSELIGLDIFLLLSLLLVIKELTLLYTLLEFYVLFKSLIDNVLFLTETFVILLSILLLCVPNDNWKTVSIMMTDA
jgi:hypothetical protein